MTDLFNAVKQLGWWGAAGLSVALAVASLALGAAVVVRWPVDHFKEGPRHLFWAGRHPVIRAIGITAKNGLGVVVVLIGVVLSLPGVPGQGLLLIFIGLTLVDFPGKHRFERRIIRRPAVLRLVNGVRQRFGRQPLAVD